MLQGAFHEGLMHGKGVYSWADGLTYEVRLNNCSIMIYNSYMLRYGLEYFNH